jgi:hypothetical protein
MLDQGCGREASPRLVRRQFVAGIIGSKFKGKYWTITKSCILWIKFLTVPDKKNNLIVNIELTKLKVTVRINSKWPNLGYLSLYLVGKNLTFPVTTKLYIPWMELAFPTLRIGRLYFERG